VPGNPQLAEIVFLADKFFLDFSEEFR